MDYKSKTIYELKELCKQRKIRGFGGKNKDALITLLGGKPLAAPLTPVSTPHAEFQADPIELSESHRFTYIFERAGGFDTFEPVPATSLLTEMMEIIDTSQPRYVILENTRELVVDEKSRTYQVLKYELTKRGYFHRFRVLDTGVHNCRIYTVALKEQEAYDVLDYVHTRAEEAIISILMNPTVNNKYIYNADSWVPSTVAKTNTIYTYNRMYISKDMGDKQTPRKADSREYTVRECFNFDNFGHGFKN